MSIWDAHVHAFSRAFFEALFEERKAQDLDPVDPSRWAEECGLELPDASAETHARRWIEELDRNAVDGALLLASHPKELDAVLEMRAVDPSRFEVLGSFRPIPDAAEQERFVRSSLEKGVRGFLFFPSLHGYAPGDPHVEPVWKMLAEHRAFALVHCGVLRIPLRDALGLRSAYVPQWSNPLEWIPVARANPDTSFVVAQFGAGLLRESLLLAADSPNVLLDTSSSHSWRASQPDHPSLADVFERALDVVGPERIVFGTDSSSFPRGWRRDLFDGQLEALLSLRVSRPTRDLIFSGNLLRLLAESGPETAPSERVEASAGDARK